jgi:2-oxoglutarate ferredoxin oxidoreductase subunit gamma
MSRAVEIRLSGSGGQGLILAGIILANAAVLDKKRVTQTQSYGPESRGGYSRADVLISENEIFFPEATQFDILLSLTQEACDKYIFDLREKGTLIVDTTLVKNISVMSENVYEVPFTEIVIEKLGSPITTNICSLAFLVHATGIVKTESLEQAIKDSVKSAFVDLNIKAMKLGFELAKEYRK